MSKGAVSPPRHLDDVHVCIWRNLTKQMDRWDDNWRSQVRNAKIKRRVEMRQRGATFTDETVFEALLLSILSGNTRSDTIDRISIELTEPFHGFDLDRFAEMSPAAVEREIVRWFLDRKAGSTSLRRSLARLQETAKILAGREFGDRAEDFILAVASDVGDQPEDIAVALGSSRRWKLPGFGIALAAEALKHIGFEICKPDRHVLRCIASWSLISYRKWPVRSDYTAPEATPAELYETMCMVRSFANANDLGVNHVNSAIWLAGAVSGARLTNHELQSVATGCL